ncbi:MAG: Mov34/MPN/PAD-1 family protein [Actinomycetota bacterium]
MSFATPTLRLTESQYRTIVGHCYDGLPDEACGLLTGPMRDSEPTGVITEARPARNADASARTYTVDSRDLLAAMRVAEATGDEIVGVWHSHTHTDAYPSPTDVRQALDPAWIYVIVSLRAGQEPVLRGYRIRDGEIAEVAVVRDRR